MNVDLTLEQVWYNRGLRDYLMREQAQWELKNLISRLYVRAVDLFDRLEGMYTDFDDLEEDLYTLDTDELIESIGVEYFDGGYETEGGDEL